MRSRLTLPRRVAFAALSSLATDGAQAQCGTWSSPPGLAPAQLPFCMQVWNDGTGSAAYFGGQFSGPTGVGQQVMRWDGNSATPLGPPFPFDGLWDFAVFDDGTGEALYVAGVHVGGPTVAVVLRWSGASWIPLGTFPGRALALEVFDDGSGPQLYAGMLNGLARWTGSAWQVLATSAGPFPWVEDLAVHDDGAGPALFIGGRFTSIGGLAGTAGIALWRNGALSSVGGGINVNGAVYALASSDLDGTRQLYAGGDFTSAGSTSASQVARWNGSQWAALATGLQSPVTSLVPFDDGTGTALFAGGSTQWPGLLVARWNGTAWTAPGGGLPGTVCRVLGVHDDGNGGRGLIVVGLLTPAGGGPATWRLARWDGCAFVGYCAGDGSSSPCPCGNTGASGNGCRASPGGTGASLTLSGTASVENDTLHMQATRMENSTLAVFLQGSARANGGQGVPFGDGVLCLDGTLVRLAVRSPSGGSTSYGHGIPGDVPAHVRGSIPPGGGTVHLQAYYRDTTPVCSSSAFNVTNAITAIWAP